MNIFEAGVKEILRCVKKEKKTLENNFSIIGYLMHQYELCFTAGRAFNENYMWDNPKNDIIELETYYGNKKSNYGFLISAGWDLAIKMDHSPIDYHLDIALGRKKNKTFEDWIKVLTHPKNKSKQYKTNQWEVYNFIFGSGSFDNWTKEGYYSQTCLEEFELLNLYFDKNLKIPNNIKPYLKFLKHPDFKKGILKKSAQLRKNTVEDKKLKESLEEVRKILGQDKNKFSMTIKEDKVNFKDLNQYSGLSSIPDHAHESYWTHGKIWADKIISEDSTQSNKKIAQAFLDRFNKRNKTT